MSLAAAFLSLVVDARFQVSANVHTRIWTNEQVLAARLYRDGQIGLQEALSRYLNAAAHLSQLQPTPFPLFSALSKGLSIRGYSLMEITLHPEKRKWTSRG